MDNTKVIEAVKPFIKVKEYAEKYGVSVPTVHKATKDRRLESKKARIDGKGREIILVEDRDVFSVPIKEEDLHKTVISGTLGSIAKTIELAFCGNTAIENWASDVKVAEVVCPNNEENTVFVDTAHIAMPIIIEEIAGKQKAVGDALAQNKRILEAVGEKYGITISDLPFDGLVNVDATDEEIEGLEVGSDTMDEGNVSGVKILSRYQCYRLSLCNYSYENSLQFIKELHGFVSRDDKRCYVLKVDITTNVKGAVESNIIPYSIKGLIAKDNKHYVGLNCHTYIVQSLGDYVDSQEMPNMLGYDKEYNAILEDRGYETSVESKIYDKAKFQLECASVEKTIGTGIKHFISSSQTNIKEAIPRCIDTGLSRVETRFLGNAISLLYTKNMQGLKLHVALTDILGRVYLRVTKINDSVKAFFGAVLGSISVMDKSTEKWVLINTIDGLTNKATGESGEKEANLNEAIAFRSIRNKPHIKIVIDKIEHSEGAIGGIINAEKRILEGSVEERKVTGNKSMQYKFVSMQKFPVSNKDRAKANLLHISSNMDTRSHLVEKTFAGIGLDEIPFEPQRINPRARKGDVVVKIENLGVIKQEISSRSQTVARSRSRVKLQELDKDISKYKSLVDNAITGKTLQKKAKNIRGILIERNGKFYIYASKRIYTLGNTSTVDANLIGTRVTASKVVRKALDGKVKESYFSVLPYR